VTIHRALISVYDKTGVAGFARGLEQLGVEILASGGTAKALTDERIPVTPLESLTGFGELLGHRVVTLHPAVHAGILARRDVPADLAELASNGIQPIDLVCVNLYPFERTVGRLDVAWEEVIEQIDVGGPAMLRAAAKNHAHVVPICRIADYEPVLEEFRTLAGVSPETRRSLATRVFETTAGYDAAVARWLGREDDFPETYVPVFDRMVELAYGENPHQRAAYYAQRGVRTHLLARVEQVQGKPLSFNNLGDLSAARMLARELEGPAAVIVKHANPCGVAVGGTIDEAFEKALAADPVSAYGGVVVLNRPVGAALGKALAAQFVEVLFAPGYAEAALRELEGKATRVLADGERRSFVTTERDLRRVFGGLLVQDRDADGDPLDTMDVVCGDPEERTWEDLLFAWTVAKHVTSNAIVLARAGQTLGIGAGQMSRVDAVRIAVEKAREAGHSLDGAVLASDAFFPFADGAQIALEAGIGAIIQPGGSKRDAEVLDAVREAGAVMVVTGRRHFRH
jgi:phosphoribosylaminoimidazolecarboxamide formyltransferase / IMP cyclohydrolase